MRPRTDVSPTFSVGASVNGALKDALINILVSLTVGSRWSKLPASHFALAGAAADAACANKSAGTASESAVAVELRKNFRRSLTSIETTSVHRDACRIIGILSSTCLAFSSASLERCNFRFGSVISGHNGMMVWRPLWPQYRSSIERVSTSAFGPITLGS
jgi:hypothetical protein